MKNWKPQSSEARDYFNSTRGEITEAISAYASKIDDHSESEQAKFENDSIRFIISELRILQALRDKINFYSCEFFGNDGHWRERHVAAYSKKDVKSQFGKQVKNIKKITPTSGMVDSFTGLSGGMYAELINY